MTWSSLRILLLLAATALTACAASTSGPEGASADATGSPATWVTRTPAAQSPAAPAAAYTIEVARAEYWMKVERDKKAPRDLEKRSKIVETCASDRMAAHAAESR